MPRGMAFDAVVGDKIRSVRLRRICRVQHFAQKGVAAQCRRDRQGHERHREHEIRGGLSVRLAANHNSRSVQSQEHEDRSDGGCHQPVKVVRLDDAVACHALEYVQREEAEQAHESRKAGWLREREAQNGDLLGLEQAECNLHFGLRRGAGESEQKGAEGVEG
eukprot:scaffold1302_cov245-Pinguiococcus_pyrenoidosus.AAC.6